MLWMETPTPRLDVAKEFSMKVKAVFPNKFLCYNLSPSFNWDAGHLTDNDIRNFCTELGKLGYCWQVESQPKQLPSDSVVISSSRLLASI